MSKEVQCKCCKEYWWEMNIHNTSGLCPNCYDYVACLGTELAKKEQIIKEMEQEIDERDKRIDRLEEDYYQETRQLDWVNELLGECQSQLKKKNMEIERLKQDYDEIWEDVYFRVKEDFELDNHCGECRRYYIEELNKQLIEQLEKVKEFITDKLEFMWNNNAEMTCKDRNIIDKIYEELDQQIKQLKEGK